MAESRLFPTEALACDDCVVDVLLGEDWFSSAGKQSMPTPGSSSDSSVVVWVERLKQGDSQAAFRLWDRYSQRMQKLGRVRLKRAPTAAFDEEDVALSAFDAFCRAVRDGRYSPVEGHDDLWPLLATITIRKANDRLKIEGALKRGGLFNAQFQGMPDDSRLVKVPDTELGPESRAVMAEECRHPLQSLNDSELEQLVVLKLDG